MTATPVPAVGPLTDRRVAIFAFAAGTVGLICVTALALFYSFEVNSNAPHVFGPISDLTTSAFNLLLLPVVWRFSQLLKTRVLWWIVVVASVAGAIASALLVMKVLDFAVATSASMAAIVAQAVWFLFANRAFLKIEGFPTGLGRYGLATGIALLSGMAVIAIGLLLPSTAQAPFWIVGVALGLFGWVSMPIWYLLAGARLRRGLAV